jgi:hypothetical protein
MMGRDDNPGVIPRAIRDVFRCIQVPQSIDRFPDFILAVESKGVFAACQLYGNLQ